MFVCHAVCAAPSAECAVALSSMLTVQRVLCVQAFERQVDALSRQLAASESAAEERGREREIMLEELRAAQQVGGTRVSSWKNLAAWI